MQLRPRRLCGHMQKAAAVHNSSWMGFPHIHRPARKDHAFIQVKTPQHSQRRAILQALNWAGTAGKAWTVRLLFRNHSLIIHASAPPPPHAPATRASDCYISHHICLHLLAPYNVKRCMPWIRQICTSRTCSSWPRALAEPRPAPASPQYQRCSRRQIPGWRSEGWRTACQPSAWGRGGGGRRAGVTQPAANSQRAGGQHVNPVPGIGNRQGEKFSVGLPATLTIDSLHPPSHISTLSLNTCSTAGPACARQAALEPHISPHFPFHTCSTAGPACVSPGCS